MADQSARTKLLPVLATPSETRSFHKPVEKDAGVTSHESQSSGTPLNPTVGESVALSGSKPSVGGNEPAAGDDVYPPRKGLEARTRTTPLPSHRISNGLPAVPDPAPSARPDIKSASAGVERPTRTTPLPGYLAPNSPPPEGGSPISLQPRDPTRYRILAEHGRGGLGRIYRARDQELGRDVALKELLQPTDRSEVRFFREALITARLEHPAIVPVHEAGRWPDGTPYYAMKLVAGRPLGELIAAAKTLDERLALLSHLVAVADAIAYAHARRIIHRDLKPSNVIVGDFGETIVIDWGLAKELAAAEDELVGDPYRVSTTSDLTIAGSVLGTPAYMSPEQARGDRVDTRTDVYSLGAMLFQICTGSPPARPSSEGLARALRRIDRDLGTIIRKALCMEPDGRYPDAGALASDLKAFESGARIAARRYSAAGVLVHWIGRHRRMSIAVAVAAMVAAVAAFLSVSKIIAQRDELVLAAAESALLSSPEEAMEYLRSYRGNDEDRVRDIAADARARGISHLLDVRRDPIISLAFVDGETLAYQSGGITRVTSLATGQGEDIAHAPAGRSFMLMSNGARALQRHTEGTVPAVDLREGSVIGLPHQGTVWDTRPLPASDRVLTTTSEGYLRIWDLASKRVVQQALVDTPVLRIDIHPNATLVAGCDAESRLQFRRLDNLSNTIGPEGKCVVEPTHGYGAAFSRPGTYYVTATGEGVSLWAMDTMQERALRGPNDRITEVAFSSRGRLVAASSTDGSAYVWETSGGTLISMVRHGTPVLRAVWSMRGEVLATGDAVGGVMVTDLSSGRTSLLRGHGTSIRSLAFSIDDALLASGDRTGEVRLWPINTAETTELAGLDGPAIMCGRSLSGRFVAAATVDFAIRLWDLTKNEARPRILDRAYASSPIIFVRDERLVVIDDKQRVRSWSLAEQDADAAVSPIIGAVAAAEGPNGDALIGTEAGVIALWAGKGAEVVLGNIGEAVLDLRMMIGGSEIAVLGRTGRVSVFDQRTGRYRPLGTHEGARALLIGAGGGGLFTASNHELLAWEPTRSGSTVVVSSRGELLVPTVSPVSPIVAFGDGSTVRVRDWDSGRERLIRGHGGTMTGLEFSSTGRYLAASFADGAVRLLDLETDALAVHREHARPVYHLRFAADGSFLVSGGYDHSLRIWTMSQVEFQPASTSISVGGLATIPGGQFRDRRGSSGP